jgi:hypothetical protein
MKRLSSNHAEEQRLEQSRERKAHWKRWGPYLSERAWSTVREDYSADGTAWDYLSHDHARSRALERRWLVRHLRRGWWPSYYSRAANEIGGQLCHVASNNRQC